MRHARRSFTASHATAIAPPHAATRWFAPLSLAAGLMLLTPFALDAQGRGRGVPPGKMPRAGECRVWYDGTPPGRQPRPTSCERARYEAARYGGRVLYGTDRRKGRGDRDDDYGRWEWERDRSERRFPDRWPSESRYPDGRGRDDRDRERRDRERRDDGRRDGSIAGMIDDVVFGGRAPVDRRR